MTHTQHSLPFTLLAPDYIPFERRETLEAYSKRFLEYLRSIHAMDESRPLVIGGYSLGSAIAVEWSRYLSVRELIFIGGLISSDEIRIIPRLFGRYVSSWLPLWFYRAAEGFVAPVMRRVWDFPPTSRACRRDVPQCGEGIIPRCVPCDCPLARQANFGAIPSHAWRIRSHHSAAETWPERSVSFRRSVRAIAAGISGRSSTPMSMAITPGVTRDRGGDRRQRARACGRGANRRMSRGLARWGPGARRRSVDSCLDTPGAHPRALCLFAARGWAEPALFSGDTLFKPAPATASTAGTRAALPELQSRPGAAARATRVLPGHEYLARNLEFHARP